MQDRRTVGLISEESVEQHRSQQSVAPIPGAGGVDRGDEKVRPGDGVEEPVGALGVQDCVAQRSRHHLENRHPAQEADDVGWHVGKDFVAHEVAGHRRSGRGRDRERRTGGPRSAPTQSQQRQVHTGGPSLRRGHDVVQIVRSRVPRCDLQQVFQLVASEGEIRRAQLQDLAAGSPGGRREPHGLAARHRELDVVRKVGDQQVERVLGVLVVHLVDVVDDQYEWLVVLPEGGNEARHHLADDGDAGRLGTEHCGRDSEGTPDGGGDEDEQRYDASVLRAERHPRERAVVAPGPLGEQRALAVADRRRQHDHGTVRSAEERLDEPWTVDEPGPVGGHVELCLDQSAADVLADRRGLGLPAPARHQAERSGGADRSI